MGVCLEPAFLRILYICKIILNILRFIVPIGLIFRVVWDIYKQILDPSDKEGMKHIKNRVIAAVIVFLVPAIISLIVSFINKVTNANVNSGLGQCLEFSNSEYIKVLEDKNSEKLQEYIDQEKDENISLDEKKVKAVRRIVEENKQ